LSAMLIEAERVPVVVGVKVTVMVHVEAAATEVPAQVSFSVNELALVPDTETVDTDSGPSPEFVRVTD